MVGYYIYTGFADSTSSFSRPVMLGCIVQETMGPGVGDITFVCLLFGPKSSEWILVFHNLVVGDPELGHFFFCSSRAAPFAFTPYT